MKKNKKRLLLSLLLVGMVLFLSACANNAGAIEPINADSTGFFDQYIVYPLSQVIIWFSDLFGRNYGLGIIAVTLIIRIILIPVYRYQTKSTRKMTDIQPQIKALDEKYSSKDTETQELKAKEQEKLMEEAGVNPLSGYLPLLIQTPILIALYQAISRTEVIAQSDFLWANLGQPDPYYILPLLAAVLMFISLRLNQAATPSQSGASGMMMSLGMPILIFLITFNLASALSLYFVTSNAFSIVQTLLFNNPFKIRREREEKEEEKRQAERDRQRALRRAKKTGRTTKK